MASSYDISLGSDVIEILASENNYATIQIVSTSDLDSAISVSLKHSSDEENYESIASTTTAIASGVTTVLIETLDYTLDTLYLDIDVLAATVGTLNIFISTKKKEDNGVVATITGTVDASISGDVSTKDGSLHSLISELYTEQRITNKILMEVFDIVINNKDLK
tara:strand:+ start:455 stop:946 length:492 start_codon:yes stop_codon:yes gene_type:complete